MRNILLIIIVFLLSQFNMAIAGKAVKFGNVDWTFSGSMRLEMAYMFKNLGDQLDYGERNTFILETPGNSWLRTTAKLNKITAVAEIGLYFDEHRYVRHAYLTYDIDEYNQLTAGKTWTLLAEVGPYSFAGYFMGLWGVGDLFSFRHDQLQYAHTNKRFQFKIAIEDQKKEEGEEFLRDNHDPTSGLESEYTTEDHVPSLLGSFSLFLPGFRITPSFLLQTYKLTPIERYKDEVDDITINTYAFAINSEFKYKAFSILCEAWFGQNIDVHTGESNMSEHNDYPMQRIGATTYMGKPYANETRDDIVDLHTFGGYLQFGININKKNMIHIGGGYQQANTKKKGPYFEKDVSVYGTYLNYTFIVNKSCLIIPGIAFYDWGKDVNKNAFGLNKNDLGSDVFVGVFMMHNF